MWLLSLAAVALGAPVRVDLPEGETIEAWREALEVAELEPAPHAAAAIRLFRGASRWTLVVELANGEVRRAEIEPPLQDGGRARVAQLAASLLVSTGLEGLPVVLPPAQPDPRPARPARPHVAAVPTAPSRPRPAPAAAPAAEAASVWGEPPHASREEAPVTSAPVISAPVRVAPVAGEAVAGASPAPSTPPSPPPPVVVDLEPAGAREDRSWAWVSARTGLCAHPGEVAAAPVVSGLAGVALRPWLHLGGGVAVVAPMTVDLRGVVPGDRALLSAGARGGAWLGDRARVGVVGGLARRTFLDGGRPVASLTVPSLGAEVSAGVGLPRGARLQPTVGVHRDLRRIDLFVGAEPLGRLVPTTVEVLLDLQFSGRNTW